MKIFARARPHHPPARPSFGAWVLRQFLGDRDLASLSFAELERTCASAGSILCGAAYANPGAARGRLGAAPATIEEAALVARRTADGFQAALSDREHVVVTWPWDHLATRLAWLAQERGTPELDRLGRDLETIASAYAIYHREQLAQVIGLWREIAGAVTENTGGRGLDEMGSIMERAFAEEAGAPAPVG
ncbi:MAG: hypothetical protein HY875_12955 [Chloroflexi bacterium]|nr:hypothetical protein [Chloroflexota bacterium]